MRTDLAAHLGSIKWDLAPLWSVAPRVDNKNVGMIEKNLLSLSYGRVIRKDITAIGGLRPESYETYNVIEDGDVVLRMTDLQNDKKSIRTGQASERGLITSAYITVRPSQSETDPRFVAAVLRAYDIQKAYYEMGAGVRQNLGYSELIDLPIPMPPQATQQRIADYLDRETGEIDTMIAKMDELAGQLEARRDAVWSAEFKEALKSGATTKLSLLIESIVDGPFGSSLTSAHYSDEGTRVVRLGNIGINTFRNDDTAFIPLAYAAKLGAHAVLPGDVVVAGLGDERMPLGRAAVLPDIGPAIVKADCYRVRPNHLVSASYLAWALSAPQARSQFKMLSRGTTRARLNTKVVQQVEIPLITSEQQARLLDRQTSLTGKIDNMLAKVAELKSLLTERRSALITDVVTGRKEVA